MKISDRIRRAIQALLILSLLGLVIVLAFAAGFGVSRLIEERPDLLPFPTSALRPTATPSATAAQPVEDESFQLFWEVWDVLQNNYYGDLPDMEAVTYGAIQGMLDTLGDEYTSFIEPDVAEIVREDATGSFEGIGAFVSMREDGNLEIVSVFPDQPAERAGLQSGDLVLAVDGESIVGLDLYEAISHIRGPAGSQATLLIKRPGEPETFEVTVTRARIDIPLVETEMLEGDVGYIRLYEFSATAASSMEEALAEILAQEPVGLVFDLRSNPGGWLDQSVNVADLFLDEGTVLIERHADGHEDTFRSRDGDPGESIPLVVLVDVGSASASEIVAGAIQARGRGILVGTQTFGKGSVQRPYTLSDGSELRVTVALWFTPDDVAIHGQGLTPDIEVIIPADSEQDTQLERAVEYLLTGE